MGYKKNFCMVPYLQICAPDSVLNLSSLKTSKTVVVLIVVMSSSRVLRAPYTSLYHFGPLGPDLSNPTSFLRPALSMAPTTDGNARDKWSVPRLNPATF